MSNEPAIEPRHLPYFLNLNQETIPLPNAPEVTPIDEKNEMQLDSEEIFNLHALEKQTIRRALAHTKNNRTDAAKLLGISRRTLQRKLKDLD